MSWRPCRDLKKEERGKEEARRRASGTKKGRTKGNRGYLLSSLKRNKLRKDRANAEFTGNDKEMEGRKQEEDRAGGREGAGGKALTLWRKKHTQTHQRAGEGQSRKKHVSSGTKSTKGGDQTKKGGKTIARGTGRCARTPSQGSARDMDSKVEAKKKDANKRMRSKK